MMRHPMIHERAHAARATRLKRWLSAIGLLVLALLGSLAWWSPW